MASTPVRGYRLLYFVNAKMALNAKFCCVTVFIYQYLQSFVFPETAGDGLQPPSPSPSKSATGGGMYVCL